MIEEVRRDLKAMEAKKEQMTLALYRADGAIAYCKSLLAKLEKETTTVNNDGQSPPNPL